MRLPLLLVAALLSALAFAVPAHAAGDPLRSHQWGLDMIEADAAHSVTDGSGATVAVIDTGVYSGHPDLQGRLLPGYDFVDNDSTPQDGNGHGTHVTGIVAANAGNGVGVEGVAPGAKVMPIRVLGDDGSGDSANVAKGVDWAVDHRADVINLSLGGTPIVGDDTTFTAALNRALDAGIVVVAAAGNDGLPICEQPGTNGRLLCVGAVDKRGQRSVFSSFGNGVGVMAPGGSALPGTDEDILSTWNDGGYQELAGTSQATPHVSGVAALLVSLGLHGQQVVDRIASTATDAGAPGPDPVYGNGIVNARAAVAGLSRSRSGGGAPGGGGGGSTGGGGAGGPGPRVTIPARVSARALRKHGLRIRCFTPKSSRCVATLSKGGRRVAKASRGVRAGRTATVAPRTRARVRAITARVTLDGARFSRRVRVSR